MAINQTTQNMQTHVKTGNENVFENRIMGSYTKRLNRQNTKRCLSQSTKNNTEPP